MNSRRDEEKLALIFIQFYWKLKNITTKLIIYKLYRNIRNSMMIKIRKTKIRLIKTLNIFSIS